MLKATICFSNSSARAATDRTLGHGHPRAAGDPERDDQQQDQHGTATLSSRPELARPPLYKVVVLNDDYTPMEFVVDVLMQFFHMPEEKATQIMLTIHTKGQAVCGVYSKDVAETKALQVNEHSREHGQPLLCQVEVDQ